MAKCWARNSRPTFSKIQIQTIFSLNFSLQPLAMQAPWTCGADVSRSTGGGLDSLDCPNQMPRVSSFKSHFFRILFVFGPHFVITAFIQLHRSGDQEFGRHPVA